MNIFAILSLVNLVSDFKSYRQHLRQILISCCDAGVLQENEFVYQLQHQLPILNMQILENSEELRRMQVQADLARLRGVQFIAYGEKNYPETYYRMEDPPLCISILGSPVWSKARSRSALSVVGSREPRDYSLNWMESELSLFLQRNEVYIVSGGARGVDQRAHALAMRSGRPTVVVLPSGLGEMYPANIKDWVESVIAGGGCVVSEYFYEQRMQKFLFHHRNRLIAGLGVATLIIESRRRSGTMTTAQASAQIGRPVWVIPGHPQDFHFTGSLDLLCDGATLVRDAQDLDIFFKSEVSYDLNSTVRLEVEL